MRSTFQNSGTALSIGVFFSLMIAGLAGSLPGALTSGLEHQGVRPPLAQHMAPCPRFRRSSPRCSGVNPIEHLLAASNALTSLPAAAQQVVTGRGFFPHLISGPFSTG